MRFLPEEKRDLKTIENCFEKISKLNKILDENLSNNEFIAGSKISVADFNIAHVASTCFMVKVDTSNLKDWNRWISNITSRESFKKINEIIISLGTELMLFFDKIKIL
ncbi:MAG: hypothetical protein KatS3mg068_1151 [Candidatus Sericytochromatia bacterium]|nr:MAG: hypothetical protein KatS3mg068_1151 [Candidatus Sericytochromatia bacterium]